jgi:hypothetical protein
VTSDGSCDVDNAEDCTACDAGFTLIGQVCIVEPESSSGSATESDFGSGELSRAAVVASFIALTTFSALIAALV